LKVKEVGIDPKECSDNLGMPPTQEPMLSNFNHINSPVAWQIELKVEHPIAAGVLNIGYLT
jgi:hypothetical protein